MSKPQAFDLQELRHALGLAIVMTSRGPGETERARRTADRDGGASQALLDAYEYMRLNGDPLVTLGERIGIEQEAQDAATALRLRVVTVTDFLRMSFPPR